ncbi:MAG: hypothetical protein ACR5KW_02960 [Wolbachia sp.]
MRLYLQYSIECYGWWHFCTQCILRCIFDAEAIMIKIIDNIDGSIDTYIIDKFRAE